MIKDFLIKESVVLISPRKIWHEIFYKPKTSREFSAGNVMWVKAFDESTKAFSHVSPPKLLWTKIPRIETRNRKWDKKGICKPCTLYLKNYQRGSCDVNQSVRFSKEAFFHISPPKLDIVNSFFESSCWNKEVWGNANMSSFFLSREIILYAMLQKSGYRCLFVLLLGSTAY